MKITAKDILKPALILFVICLVVTSRRFWQAQIC